MLTEKLNTRGAALTRDYATSRSYLVGVSGGRDSVALLHWLARLGFTKLIVCHFDHQLRGRASRADAAFVERLATRSSFRFVLGQAEVRKIAREQKHSIETAARLARYRFFAEVARRRRCATIFLGHHADDLVETCLLNFFRGAGPAGLVGMREVAQRTIDGTALTIVRPLLGIWRAEIDEYVRGNGLRFREDATNAANASTRNRIRHQLLPAIEEHFGRDVRANVWRTADVIAEEEFWIARMIDDFGAVEDELSVRTLRLQPVALQRRIIHRWLAHHEVSAIGYELVERIRALLPPDSDAAKVNLPRDLHVRRRAGKIFLERLPPSRGAET